MKVLFKYATSGNGVELYLSSFTVNNVVKLFDSTQAIKITKFFARDFSRQYLLDHVAHINTLALLHTFVKNTAELVLDVIEFDVLPDVHVAMNDTTAPDRSGEFSITLGNYTGADLPPLFKKIVKDFFPSDLSSVLSEHVNKYVFADFNEDTFSVFETLEAYLDSPERNAL